MRILVRLLVVASLGLTWGLPSVSVAAELESFTPLSGGANLVAHFSGDRTMIGGFGFDANRAGALVVDPRALEGAGTVRLSVQDGRGNLVPGYTINVAGTPQGNDVTLTVDQWAQSAYESGDLSVLGPDGKTVFSGNVVSTAPTLAPVPAPPASQGGGGQQGGGGGAGQPGGGSGGAGGPLVPCGGENQDLCTIPKLVDLAVNIFNWLILVGGVAAVLAMVVAGIRIIVAVLEGASSQTITAAKQSLTYAVLGTIFLLTAYVIVNTVYHALGGTGKPPGLL